MVQEITNNDADKFIPGRLGLSREEKEKLRKFSRKEIGREATRALIILWYDERKTESEIAALLFISERTVRRCIQRYKEKNIEGLHDKEKSGRPRKADEKVEKVIEEAMKKNPEDVGYSSGYWITSILCIHIFTVLGVALSNNTVRRVLCRLDYVFRRPKLWSGPGGENPPEIEKALEKVKKNKAVLLYQDETSFHLLPVLRKMWMKIGEQVKILTPKNWNKCFSVFGALNPLSGEIIFEIFERKNGTNFITFIELLLKKYPKDIYLVVDRATYHRSKLVKEWLAKNTRVHLIYLPTKSPQLNPIEDVWRWLKGSVAANRTYTDLEPLMQSCRKNLSSLTPQDVLRISGLTSQKRGQIFW